MNYREKDYEEIIQIMLDDSVENGLASKAEDFSSFIANQEDISNYYVMDKAVIAHMFSIAYDDATLVYNSFNVELAEGEDLNKIGDRVGVPRPVARHASALVTFTIQEEILEDINIEAGIVIATDDGIEYETVEPLYLSADSTSTTVQCLSVDTGVEAKVMADTLVNIVSTLDYSFSCTNQDSSSGGEEEYSDEDYRYLLENWILIHLKGSDEAFENYFANFDGIDGYKLVPNWNGTGTMKVILDPGTPYLLNQAYEELQAVISQATEDITMFAPVEVPIDIYATVNVDIDQINPYSDLEKEDIKNRIVSAIRTFIDEGYRNDDSWYNGLSIGEDFIPHKLAVFLDEEIPELKNINFSYPADYVKILDEERGKANNIVIEMV